MKWIDLLLLLGLLGTVPLLAVGPSMTHAAPPVQVNKEGPFKPSGNAIQDIARLNKLRPANGKDRWSTAGPHGTRIETPYKRAIDSVNAHYGGAKKFKAILNLQRRHES